MLREKCDNLNHRRSKPPVRCCPTCGEVVNNQIPGTTCGDETHAKRRMSGAMFCLDCGAQLRAS